MTARMVSLVLWCCEGSTGDFETEVSSHRTVVWSHGWMDRSCRHGVASWVDQRIGALADWGVVVVVARIGINSGCWWSVEIELVGVQPELRNCGCPRQ
jgi:hypothetical protein